MSLETTLTPLNGLEIKKVLKSDLINKIDAIPYLREGNAYKQVELYYEFWMKCYPPDCPTPTAEWQTLIGITPGVDLNFDVDKQKLDMLEERRNELAEAVEKIDEFLETQRKLFYVQEEIKDNGKPDGVRLEYKLPVPMIDTGKAREVMVPAEEFVK